MSDKARVYAVRSGRLLVFTQPDFPEAGTQVPGGTIELGETAEAAARREFTEETGLAVETLVALEPYADPTGAVRFPFLCDAPAEWPDSWEHEERHASGGAAPIRLLYGWIALADAKLRLRRSDRYAGMATPIEEIMRRIDL